VIGRILRARVKDEKAAAVVDNLIARVRAWWWMVAVFAAAFLLGRNATIAMFAFISFFALREFLTLTPTKIGDHRALSVAFFIVIPIQYLLIATSWYGLFSIFIPSTASCFCLRSPSWRTTPKASWSVAPRFNGA
jgi:phosphatidate cytidylyltransferase